MNGNWHEVEQHLSKILGKPIQFTKKISVSGGCINQTWKITDTQNNHWFIKTNSPALEDMFRNEADGLNKINKSESIRVPDAITYGSAPDFSYLILEYITMQAQINQKSTGAQLAQMHRFHNPSKNSGKQFGWPCDNTIGSTPQSNKFKDSWIEFWKNERLLYQLNLAKSKGYSYKAYDNGLKLANNLSLFFTNYQAKPSLLHGDLWSGNCASDMGSNPVIYDPAAYYGDREADIAMTELFGGFSTAFYDAYNANYALDSGYKTRKTLYNLYHILNHFNLFGGDYASQATSMTGYLLSEF